MAKKPTLDSVDASLAKWKTRLKRAMTMIGKLERQRKRLANPRPSGQRYPIVMKIMRSADATLVEVVKDKPPVKSDDLDLPPFLDRSKLEPASVEIAREQAETKKRKAKGRIEKLKAKQRGDLKKMPLSGKAALDHIDNG
jgi:hypothetical protein